MNINLSTSYIMRSAYSGSTGLREESGRKYASKHTLVDADRKAMVRAIDRIKGLDYENTDRVNTKNIYNVVSSYIDIYNNTMKSTSQSDSSDIKRMSSKLKQATKNYSKELQTIGLTVKSDGTLQVDKKKLKTATTKEVKKLFSDDSEYLKDVTKLMKKLRTHINREPDVELDTDGQSSLNLLV